MKLIVDFQAIAKDHTPFNTCFLRLIRDAFPGETVKMACREDHHQAILPYVGQLGIEFIPVPEELHNPPRGRLVAQDERAHYAFVVELCRRFRVEHLILLGVRADMLRRLRAKRPAARIDIVLHGTLAEPSHWRSRNPFRKRLDLWGVMGRRFPRSMQFIFLEEGIADRMVPMMAPDTRWAVLPHPIPGAPLEAERPLMGEVIDVGFFGVSLPGKGFEHFLKLAERRNPQLRLNCVGPKGKTYDSACDGLFGTPPAQEKLTQEAFDALAQDNDLVFLPLDPIAYDFIASGTLIDAIRFSVPPVLPRNAVVTALERRYGRFAYVVEDEAEGIALVSALTAERLREELPGLRATERAIAADRTVEAVAPLFRAMMGAADQGIRGQA